MLKNLGRTVLTLATLSLVGCGEEQTRGDVASEAPASPRGTEAVISTLRDGNATGSMWMGWSAPMSRCVSPPTPSSRP